MSKEYIEREALLEDIGETVLFSVRGGAELPTPEMRGYNKVINRIKSAPTADVVEVRHGEWVDCKCSACGEVSPTIRFNEWEMDYQIVKSPYCPNCGAKMDGKGEGDGKTDTEFATLVMGKPPRKVDVDYVRAY